MSSSLSDASPPGGFVAKPPGGLLLPAMPFVRTGGALIEMWQGDPVACVAKYIRIYIFLCGYKSGYSSKFVSKSSKDWHRVLAQPGSL